MTNRFHLFFIGRIGRDFLVKYYAGEPDRTKRRGLYEGRLGWTYNQPAILGKGSHQTVNYPAPHIRRQVHEHVPAENDIHLSNRSYRADRPLLNEIDPGKGYLVLDKGRNLISVIGNFGEILGHQALTHVSKRPLGIDPLLRLFEKPRIDVRGQNGYFPSPERRFHLIQKDGDGVGLLTAAARGAPESDASLASLSRLGPGR